jgi:hypothetical protein
MREQELWEECHRLREECRVLRQELSYARQRARDYAMAARALAEDDEHFTETLVMAIKEGR